MLPSSTPAISRNGAGAKVSANGSSKRKWRRRIIALILLLLLLLLGGWYWSPSSAFARLRDLQQELASGQLSPEERKEKLAALRAEQENLSSEERQEWRKERGKVFMQKRNAEAAKYLSLSPEERRKLIDERLGREKAWEQKIAQQSGGNGKGPQGPGAGPGGPGRSGGPGGPGGFGPGGPRGGGTPEERDVRRRDFLLSATPEARAGMDQMRMDMAARRAELGLPPKQR
jgi:hypothetical protein